MSGEDGESQIVFYRLAPAWGLPSLSAACNHVQAYLQLAGIQHSVEDCATVSISPTGHVPALEWNGDLVGDPDAAAAGFQTARNIVSRLQRGGVSSLDSWLSDAQHADMLAFAALAEARLEPATVFTTWVEQHSYSSHTAPAYGAGMPALLRSYIPWRARREVLQRFAGVSREQVYAEAAAVFKALDERLRSGGRGGRFFFGDRPSSLDALLFAHLLYLQSAPVSAPELRSKMAACASLAPYVRHVAQACQTTVPQPPPARRADWDRGGGEPSSSGQGRMPGRMTEAERRQQQRSIVWLALAAGAIVAYVVVGGQYIQIGFDYDEEPEEEE